MRKTVQCANKLQNFLTNIEPDLFERFCRYVEAQRLLTLNSYLEYLVAHDAPIEGVIYYAINYIKTFEGFDFWNDIERTFCKTYDEIPNEVEVRDNKSIWEEDI
jgi:hypothetical protein